MAEVENKQTQEQQAQGAEGTTHTEHNFEEFFTKLDEIVDKRLAGVAKSSLKDGFGIEDEAERNEAYKNYINYKQNQKTKAETDYTALKTQNAELTQRLFNIELNGAASKAAKEIGMNPENITHALKLADMTEATKDGKIDNDKLKDALQKVLDDIPAFKGESSSQDAKETNTDTGVRKVGAKDSEKQTTDVLNEFRKAIGLDTDKDKK